MGDRIAQLVKSPDVHSMGRRFEPPSRQGVFWYELLASPSLQIGVWIYIVKMEVPTRG